MELQFDANNLTKIVFSKWVSRKNEISRDVKFSSSFQRTVRSVNDSLTVLCRLFLFLPRFFYDREQSNTTACGSTYKGPFRACFPLGVSGACRHG